MDALIARHVFCFVFPILISLYIVPIFIKIAFRFKILDLPDGKIKKHKKPTPYMGGFAIYLPFIATLAIAYPFENKILWLLLGVSLLLFIGFIDDLKVMTPLQKLAGQVIAVLCFLKGGYSLKITFFSHIFNIFISGFWMLALINAFNLIDVMDGLVAVVSIVAASSFFVIALLFKQYFLSLLLLTFLSSMLVFFFYNKPEAKIYLGDAGAMFVGGFFAAIPQLFNWSKIGYFAYYSPVIILGIPLLELFFLVIIRTINGIPFYKGSPHHFSIYLKNRGWSKYSILTFVFVVGLFLSFIAFLFLYNYISLVQTAILGFIFLLFWIYFIFI